MLTNLYFEKYKKTKTKPMDPLHWSLSLWTWNLQISSQLIMIALYIALYPREMSSQCCTTSKSTEEQFVPEYRETKCNHQQV